jgi:hypothetical protein
MVIEAAVVPKFDTKIFKFPLASGDIKCLNRFIDTAARGDPALIIQFDENGVQDRENRFPNVINAKDEIRDFLVQRGLVREADSDIVFYHTSLAHVMGTLTAMMRQMPWCRHDANPIHPDIGYVYVMLTERRRPDTTLLEHVFNHI